MARGRGRGRGGVSGTSSERKESYRKAATEAPKYSRDNNRDDMDEVLRLNDDSPAGDASESDKEEEVMVNDDEADEEDYEEDDDEDDDDGERAGGFKEALKQATKRQEFKPSHQKGSDVQDAAEQGTSGWRDFYGGEDAGDESSGGGTDEDLDFEEAKRLEDLRAQRLGMAGTDPLAVLLGGEAAADVAGQGPEAAAAAGGGAAGAAARFESVFAEGAEHGSVPRDLAQLSDSRRKKLVKSEAPELAPLLSDFKEKLASLKELLPLLAPEALSKLPSSGAAYLDSKLSLLLNTLANLSYYTLLRAEGTEVRSHPVVSQLVWLKELQEKIAPLDTKLRLASKRASRAAQSVAAGREAAPEANAAELDEALPEPVEAPRRLTIRERLRSLRLREARASAAPSGVPKTKRAETIVADLLRLPGKSKRSGSKGGAPADLHEVDPTVGAFMPMSTLGEQVMGAQQYVNDIKKRTQPKSADLEAEAKPRRRREQRGEYEPPPEPIATPVAEASSDDGEGDPEEVREAKAKAKAKKERKLQLQKEREEATRLSQFHPEDEKKGRRRTSRKILMNKGVVRVRKKTAANSRVSYKDKHAKKVTRRKGAVQDMRQGADDGTYQAEATGINTRTRKSLRLS